GDRLGLHTHIELGLAVGHAAGDGVAVSRAEERELARGDLAVDPADLVRHENHDAAEGDVDQPVGRQHGEPGVRSHPRVKPGYYAFHHNAVGPPLFVNGPSQVPGPLVDLPQAFGDPL